MWTYLSNYHYKKKSLWPVELKRKKKKEVEQLTSCILTYPNRAYSCSGAKMKSNKKFPSQLCAGHSAGEGFTFYIFFFLSALKILWCNLHLFFFQSLCLLNGKLQAVHVWVMGKYADTSCNVIQGRNRCQLKRTAIMRR